MGLPTLSKYMSREAVAGRFLAGVEHGLEAVPPGDEADKSRRRRVRSS
jgi:hypothetical protein